MDASFWNERYSSEEYVFGTEPNEYFKSKIDLIPPGKILVPAAGEGRDAVYAAKLGWEVYAFDMSEVGRQKSLLMSAKINKEIRYDILDVTKFDVQLNEFDAVVISYFHLPDKLRKEFFAKIVLSLKYGGVIILEAFTPKQLFNRSGGPNDIALFLTPEILAMEFNSLDIIENNEHEIVLNEGTGHVGKANVVRFFARKK
jgi:SAM-dependent methyltransferase